MTDPSSGGALQRGLQAAWCQARSALQTRAGPRHHGHARLHVGRDRIGRAMQEQAVLAQGLPVVGDVDQRRVDRVRACLQLCDRACEQVIGVEQCVVVGIGDLLHAAVAQFVAAAVGQELREAFRVAPEVRGPVIAEHVQYPDLRARRGRQACVEILHQPLVQTAPPVAGWAVRQRCHLLEGQAVAGALATALVVAPLHRNACACGHVQQRLLAADAALVVVPPAYRRKHAGH